MTASASDRFALRFALAFVWLATGLGVLSPYYRDIGEQALEKIGLRPWVMVAACVFEVLLGLRLLLGPLTGWLALLQGALIVGFTIILGVSDPPMLCHPLGVLTKNLPLLALIGSAWLLEREGWSRRTLWLLRVGMASVWLLEGLLPNLLFPSQLQQDILVSSGLPIGDPALAIKVASVLQVLSFAAALLLWGWPLRLLVAMHALGVIVVCVIVTHYDPRLWLHPFGPLTKNVSILIGTLVVLRRLSATDLARDTESG
jgi:uncharacterized membrane protein YphA (DoxX/SURF4 family)